MYLKLGWTILRGILMGVAFCWILSFVYTLNLLTCFNIWLSNEGMNSMYSLLELLILIFGIAASFIINIELD